MNALGNTVRLSPVELTEADQVRLTHLFPGTKYLQTAKLLTVPAPKDLNYEPLRDQAIIDYMWALLARVFVTPQD